MLLGVGVSQANLYRNLRDDSKLYVFLMRYAR